ncbi:MAG: glycerol kinase GlpK [Treponema sp.]|jgi:glycerol kinase|nr:glycerol kinase GlpK [Treponema sp.]
MMEGGFILAIDQSTSGTKALVLDSRAAIVARADKAHEQKISPEGWISHDPVEIYHATLAAVREAAAKAGIDKSAILGAGISNQRETALVWDKSSGLPVGDSVVWQCARGASVCENLSEYADEVRSATGLRLSPYFSAAKIAWILEHIKGGATGNLCAGTIDAWLVYRLSGNCKTDYSNASRTQLFNISRLEWDRNICGLFGIDLSILPEVCDSNGDFGSTDFEGFLPRPVPIRAVMGDSHGALFAQGCLQRGTGKATYGTGSSVMLNIGEAPVFCKNVVTSLAWGISGKVNYVLEGNINYTGAVIKWLVDDVKLIRSSGEAGILAARANPADRSYLVPAFSGLGAPYWASGARAVLYGMTRTTGKAEIVRAAEESIAYQIADVIRAIAEESGIALKELCVDGGPTRDTYLMQFQSDILNIPLSVPAYEELSALGAGYMAGIALGFYTSAVLREAARTRFEPSMKEAERKKRIAGWKEAVRLATGG